MADMNINALPLAPSIADDSLMVMEQQGTAMKVTGLLIKNYAKEGVEMEFKDDVDKANAAADRAVDAVSAVTGMTVSAHASDTAAVVKSEKGGKVHLEFGIPRGERGEQGIEGPVGPRGLQGNPGNGLTILGHYDTEDELRAAVKSPNVGDAYGVGTETPYDVYVYDGITLDWLNYGPLSGGGGGPLPDNVVTADGGGKLEFDRDLGYAPFTVEFTDEEEPPLQASDIVYDKGTVEDAIEQLFTFGSEAKDLISSAVTAKGVPTSADDTWQGMAENIGKIQTGSSTGDATATPGDIVAPKTAYTATGKVEGIIPSLPAHTFTPGTQVQTIPPGNYVAGTQTIQGDKNLVSANIRDGITIFGVKGAMQSEFKATLTVTVEIGAEVTATHENKQDTVSALCTTGAVVLELPVEGNWTVTARRGVAQYTSEIINVSSSYKAILTAVVHIEYFSTITPLSVARYSLAATSFGDYALFGAGDITDFYSSSVTKCSQYLDAYNSSLTKTSYEYKLNPTFELSATATLKHAFFAGGKARQQSGSSYRDLFSNSITALNGSLTVESADTLSVGRGRMAAASIGEYSVFAGGLYNTGASNLERPSDVVDSYDDKLTHTTKTSLIYPRSELGGASNENYILFGAGINLTEKQNIVDAYSKTLTRESTKTLTSSGTALAISAGSYIIFVTSESIDAFDLFLTKQTPDPPAFRVTYNEPYVTNLKGFALFSTGDLYDPFLVHTKTDGVPISGNFHYNFAAASVGNYGLFGGGRQETSGTYSYYYSDTVHAYQYS